jgi:hypothetical protein
MSHLTELLIFLPGHCKYASPMGFGEAGRRPVPVDVWPGSGRLWLPAKRRQKMANHREQREWFSAKLILL